MILRFTVRQCILHSLLLLCFSLKLSAEKAISVQPIYGKVVDAFTEEPVVYAFVQLADVDLRTMTNEKGEFFISGIPASTYNINIRSLGYEQTVARVTSLSDSVIIRLVPTSLSLEQVNVTALKNSSIHTSSIIGSMALEHLQGNTLSNVMQLLPGGMTTNQSLTSITQLLIRETASFNRMSSLGNSIMIDGVIQNNDANLQLTSMFDIGGDYMSTVAEGFDTRLIPMDNVESVEVLKGVLPAKYGNLTGGTVLVHTQKGKMPLNAKLKIDPNTKQVSLTKGFALAANNSFLNVAVDYAKAYADKRSPSMAFNRYSAQISYSQGWELSIGTLDLNGRLRYVQIEDIKKADKDKLTAERFESQKGQLTASLFGELLCNKGILTSLEYKMNYSRQKQFTREKVWHSNVRLPNTSFVGVGEHEGILLPHEYYSDMTIDGKPIDVNGQIIANKVFGIGSGFNKVSIGAEYVRNTNKGDGKIYDFATPPSQYMRPRSFNEIPSVAHYIGFVENKLSLRYFETILGLRVTELKAPRYDFNPLLEPRINARLGCFNGSRNKLSIRGGWGIQYKLPTLVHFYPDASYADKQAYVYNNEDTKQSMVVMTTAKFDTENRDLQIAKSTNTEVGIDFTFLKRDISIVYFNEKLRNGYAFTRWGAPMNYRVYTQPAGSTEMPTYVNGQLMIGENLLEYQENKTFAGYMRPTNAVKQEKWGVEYTINVGRIPQLSSTLLVDGTYLYIRRINDVPEINYVGGMLQGKDYPYMGIYLAGQGSNNGTITERLSSNFRLVTHIPSVRFIVSTTLQMVWNETQQRLYETNKQSAIVMKNKDGEIVYGNVAKDADNEKYIYPMAYMDLDGNISQFTEEHAMDNDMGRMVRSVVKTTYLKERVSPYCMLNMRLTKEMGRWTQLSFYANNMLNIRPSHFSEAAKYYSRLNSGISFGGELNIRF
ncbi:MAG: TonB-dependent receptor [Marinifilaceae bacterium]